MTTPTPSLARGLAHGLPLAVAGFWVPVSLLVWAVLR